jgi:hypothetical protein
MGRPVRGCYGYACLCDSRRSLRSCVTAGVSLQRRKAASYPLHKSVSSVICSRCQRQLGPDEPVCVFRRARRPIARWCKTCGEQTYYDFFRLRCVGCGRELFATCGAWRNLTCSPQCQYKARLERRKVKRQENRQWRVQNLTQWYAADPKMQPHCWECGQRLRPSKGRSGNKIARAANPGLKTIHYFR